MMHLDQERFYAELMHVCFPTGWDPAEKFRQSLGVIHQPVADGERLMKATQNLTVAMVNKGPFVRYVWTLSPTPQLSLHPLVKPHQSYERAATIDQVYFRCERQITIPIAQLNRACFLIRVFVAPVTIVANSQERRYILRDALNSMSAASVAYKGIGNLIAPVINWIQQHN